MLQRAIYLQFDFPLPEWFNNDRLVICWSKQEGIMSKTLFICFTVIFFFATSIEAADKVVVIPLNTSVSSAKLWSKGRPGTALIAHIVPIVDGYCTNPSGTKFALSQLMVDWGNADDACPQNTWVCTNDELPNPGKCDVQPFYTRYYFPCDGSLTTGATVTSLSGWVSDADLISLSQGFTKSSDDFSISYGEEVCSHYRVWCCWK